MTTTYKQKLDRALALAREAGISQASAFPPLLRGLSALGLPVRPLHFMSTFGLVTFLFLGMAAMLLGFHWFAVSIDVNARAVEKLRNLGEAGALAAAALVAPIVPMIIRVKAVASDLPGWHEL
jgi:Family of unknown function (DUF6404)